MAINKNLHIIDRSLRGFIGVSAVGIAFLGRNYVQDPVIVGLIGIFGILNLISLATGWCPIYQLAKISTRSSE